MDSSMKKWIGLGGGVALALGVFLPWVSMSEGPFSMSLSGWQIGGFDGFVRILILLLVLGGLAGALFAYGEIKMAPIAFFVAAGSMAILILKMRGQFPNGIGFYIAVAGLVAGIVGTLPLMKTGKDVSALGEMFGGKK